MYGDHRMYPIILLPRITDTGERGYSNLIDGTLCVVQFKSSSNAGVSITASDLEILDQAILFSFCLKCIFINKET